MQVEMTSTSWPHLNVLKDSSDAKFGLVILNGSLADDNNLFENLWSRAALKIAVDGASNRLYDLNVDQSHTYLPDFINGDFDSIQPEVLKFYKEKGVECIETIDQDFTDFTKCLQIISERLEKYKIDCLVVLGAFGGRMDQVFANCNTLMEGEKLLPGVKMYLLSEENLVCLLPKGHHELHMDSGYEGDWCGLIPLAGSCDHVTTTGLQWNLDNQQLKFGQIVSTSNRSIKPQVTIETDNYVLWTSGVKFM